MDRFDWLELAVEAPASARKPHSYGLMRAPDDGPTYYLAARRMRESGHFKAAAHCYSQAIGFDERNYGAWVEYIDTLVRAKQLVTADEVSQTALNNYGLVRQFYASRALVLAQDGNMSDAFGHSDVSLDGERNWYCVAVRAELLLNSRGNRSTACELLVEAVDRAEDRWEPHFVGGCILLDAQHPALAAAYFSETAHYNPRAVIGWICLGDCFHALKLYDQALFYYQKATELEPTHEVALDRQKNCVPRLYGLTRLFHQVSLRKRWNSEYEKLNVKWERTIDDF